MTGNDNASSAQSQTNDEHKRFRSELSFPYSDLESAIQLAQTIREKAGNSCETEELAAWMGQTASGGTFRSRLNAGRLFGLIETGQGRATLTPLGLKALDNSGTERAARSDAFLNVELYRALYDQNRGNALPPTPAIERQMEQLGISPKQKMRARQIFVSSADFAGFIDPTSGRFVKPGITQKEDADRDSKERRDGGGGGDLPPTLDPIIGGLLKRLPKSGDVWPEAERKLWLNLLEGSFKLIYKDKTEVA
jgi:hypothetical protein